ncbi:hypothetical protein A0U91_16720 (plasmid) [Acetobacter persici]|uniref:Uncharacterized protein n=2 Tax=Acetobacter persici TaxID=1076596 RepID=A0A1U9LJR9_9PROT|nr:hypothetical protein A0U91_16720 [Acetobacter persici]
MMWGSLLKKDTRPFTLILQDDDTRIFSQSVGCPISPSEEEFGQMMLVHHEMGHVLLKHSQKSRRHNGSGQDVLEEGYCDAFGMALTIALTKDVHAARKIASVRSDYLVLRRNSARSAELKSLAPGGGDFTARCQAGDTVLASLNYILCGDAMEYVIRRWLEEPWDADINACSLVAMDWVKANSLTPEKVSDIAVQAMSDIISITGPKISFTVKAFMLSNLMRQERRLLKNKRDKSKRPSPLGWMNLSGTETMYQNIDEVHQ